VLGSRRWRLHPRSLSLLALAVQLAACGDDGRGVIPAALAAGPAPRTVAAPPPAAGELIGGVPFVRQRPDFCGEACVEMAVRRLGPNLSQDDVFNVAGIRPELARGALARELVRAIKRLGFDPGAVWYPISSDPQRAALELEQQLRALRADLRHRVPSIICTTFGDPPDLTQHFRLAIGYDARRHEVIYHDPAVDDGAGRRMTRRQLFARWPLPYRPSQRILIRIPLRPGTLSIPAPRAGLTPAHYAQEIMRLKETFAGLKGRFSIAIAEPFIVVGDSRADVQSYAGGLIRWAVSELKDAYFPKDPGAIITIWLFKDRRSYWINSTRLTGEEPRTPFGYYSATHRALIMDIHTGGGTLVHEIVHPFVEANFPAAPSWLNEGLGSLYEGVGRRNHRIWGYLNWRLPGLQRAIRKGGILRIEELMAQSPRQFYLRDPGTSYAQSRYLLYYLQGRNLLRGYYQRFVKDHRSDPTGYRTLREILGKDGDDMDAFQRRWERYLLALKVTNPPVK
jgi:hypothetical protein